MSIGPRMKYSLMTGREVQITILSTKLSFFKQGKMLYLTFSDGKHFKENCGIRLIRGPS